MDMNSPESLEYYSRHIRIDSYGLEKQHKVSESSCLIVGLGGLGCPAALYLALSGVGRLGLCDYDEVEMGNLARQVLYSFSDVGKKKTAAAQKALRDKNPFIDLQVHNTLLNESNAEHLISQYDIVLDCTDNFHAKYLIHDTAMGLQKNLVQGSLYQTHGQMAVFAFGRSDGCMRCLWPDEPLATCVKPCADAGILSVVAGTVGLRQATTALHLLTDDAACAGYSSLYRYSTQSWVELPLPLRSDCPYCNGRQVRSAVEPLEIEYMPDQSWQVVDLRNESDQSAFPENFQVYHAQDREIMDVSLLAHNIDRAKPSVMICYKGIRSLDISASLRSLGFEQVYSYAGGYERFIKNESDSANRLLC